jgi:hypothetical protein
MAAPSGNHAESAETNVPRTVPVDHLGRLMGPMGPLEHARYRQPRHTHGYTTDDNSRALVVTAGLPGAGWARTEAAIEWFWGRNDGSRLLVDSVDGACFDGLQADRVNRNSGAESALSALGAHRTWTRLATWLTP